MSELTPVEREVSQLPAEEALAHPDCPTELWWGLAKDYPLEAQESVLYPLLTLEDPARWVRLEAECMGLWVLYTCQDLPLQDQLLFCADAGEHVLPIFEAEHPNDLRPREAIRVQRLYARGEATVAQWQAAQEGAYAFTQGVEIGAAWAAALACGGEPIGSSESEDPFDCLRLAAEAAESAALEKSSDFEIARYQSIGGVAYGAEVRWQWDRVRQYLRGEAAEARRSTSHQEGHHDAAR